MERLEALPEIRPSTNAASEFRHISEGNAWVADLELSLCAVPLAGACNIGPGPLVGGGGGGGRHGRGPRGWIKAARGDVLPFYAADGSFDVLKGHASSVPNDQGVLSNDDMPGDVSLAADLVSGPAHGTLAFRADVCFDYTPEAGFSGDDHFTYDLTYGTTRSDVATDDDEGSVSSGSTIRCRRARRARVRPRRGRPPAARGLAHGARARAESYPQPGCLVRLHERSRPRVWGLVGLRGGQRPRPGVHPGDGLRRRLPVPGQARLLHGATTLEFRMGHRSIRDLKTQIHSRTCSAGR